MFEYADNEMNVLSKKSPSLQNGIDRIYDQSKGQNFRLLSILSIKICPTVLAIDSRIRIQAPVDTFSTCEVLLCFVNEMQRAQDICRK